MESGKVIQISIGFLSIIAGIGFAIAKNDEYARKKDEKKCGPLTNFNMGLGYIFLRNKMIKWFLVILAISMGAIFLLSGFGFFD